MFNEDDVATDDADDRDVVGGVETLLRREVAATDPLLLLLLLLLLEDGFAVALGPFLLVATLDCILRKMFQSSNPISKFGGARSFSQLKIPTT